MHALARATSLQQWSEYIHYPPNPIAAAARARTMASALKPLGKRKYNAFAANDGRELTVESCEDLVENMIRLGCWRKAMAESHRNINCNWIPECVVMEFLLPTHPDHTDEMARYVKEIRLAGYDHCSLCTINGWYAFELPDKAKAWGKRVTDHERLANWHAHCAWSIPMRHQSGDGWVCCGKQWTNAEYPTACEYGPFGRNGPRWTSVA